MYKLKAKFSRPEEVPIHPYFVYPIIKEQTKSKREIEFCNKLNLDEIKRDRFIICVSPKNPLQIFL
jgi:hypothetical protein